MRTINMYGVNHAYPADNEALPKFLRDCCKALDLTVPVAHIQSEPYIKEQILKTIKKNQSDSITLSWTNNPDRMGGQYY